MCTDDNVCFGNIPVTGDHISAHRCPESTSVLRGSISKWPDSTRRLTNSISKRRGPGSAVGKVTGYRLDGPRIEIFRSLIEFVCVRQSDWIGVCAADRLNWSLCGRQIELTFVRQSDWIGVCVADRLNWRLCGWNDSIDFCVADWFKIGLFFVAEELN
jgi:hypothetical protein